MAPRTDPFRAAVARAGEPFSLTVLADRVVVRGHKLRAEIDLFPMEQLHNVQPDPPRHAVSSVLRYVVGEVAKATTAKTDRVIPASIFVRSNSCTATDGMCILEGYHGCNLPDQWLLPREFAEAVGKSKSDATAIGWSDATFTVWFGENAWLRTNVYKEQFPDTDIIFAQMASMGIEYRPSPEGFVAALQAVKPFTTGQRLIEFVDNGFYCVDEQHNRGASYALPSYMLLQNPPYFRWDAMLHAAAHAKWIAFNSRGCIWYGDVLRGMAASFT